MYKLKKESYRTTFVTLCNDTYSYLYIELDKFYTSVAY